MVGFTQKVNHLIQISTLIFLFSNKIVPFILF